MTSRANRGDDSRKSGHTRGILARLVQADERAFEAVAGWHSRPGDAVLPALSVAASYSRLWLGISGVLVLVGGKRERRAVVEAVVAVACSSAVVNIAAKGATRRRRPSSPVPPTRALEQPSSSSFPSGHSASAAAFSGVIAHHLPELAAPVNGMAAAVAFSRIYTGVHYPGDVLVGWAMGRLAARLVTALGRAVRSRLA